MPKSCEAVHCTSHNFKTAEKLSFYKFPLRKNWPERREKWIKAVKRLSKTGGPWSPGRHAVLCSKHFVTGAPVLNEDHPDYVPSIFRHHLGSDQRGKRALQRFQRREKLQNRRLAVTSSSTLKATSEFQVVAPNTASVDTPSCSDAVDIHVSAKLQDLDVELRAAKQEALTFREERDNLQEELERLQKENHKLREQLGGRSLSHKIIVDDKTCRFFTGLPLSVYFKTFQHLNNYVPHTITRDSLSYNDQFFLTLVRLRQGLSFELLAHQTGKAESTIRGCFWLWIDLIYFKMDFMLRWPSRESIATTLPSAFKKKFPRLTCIIDCFELFIEQPKNLHARSQVYSNYKKHTTVKVFVACTPLGAVSYLSSAWGGRVSDVELVRKSSFISPQLHHPGDQILADRGFLLHDDFATLCSAELITPAFTKGKKQLSAWEVEKSRGMSSVRIHVERVIGLMKNRYSILQNTLPISMVKSRKDEAEDSDLSSIDKILRVCGILINLGESIIHKEEQ